MQLTTKEMKLMDQLRKQEHSWRWVRWVSLGLSILIIACYGYISVGLYHRLHWGALTTDDAVMIAFWWPKLIIAMAMASWFVVWPLSSWRGNATRVLLLKMLDTQLQKPSDRP